MGERELRAKYGGKLDKAINRAIRAELPGGNEALDMLEKLSGPAFHSDQTEASKNPTPETVAFEKHRLGIVSQCMCASSSSHAEKAIYIQNVLLFPQLPELHHGQSYLLYIHINRFFYPMFSYIIEK